MPIRDIFPLTRIKCDGRHHENNVSLALLSRSKLCQLYMNSFILRASVMLPWNNVLTGHEQV
jgi:hypothetical protein